MTTTLDRRTPDPGSESPPDRRLPGWARGSLWAAVAIGVLSTTSYLTGMNTLTSSSTAQTALRLALPILLAALGGLWAERSGVINIGLEGMMILGTFGAAWGAYHGGVWAGLLAAVVFGALGGLLHAVATVSFNVNHIVSGVAINLLGLGVAKYLANLLFEPISGNPRQSPPVPKFDTYSATLLSDWLAGLEDAQRVGISDVAGLLRGLVTDVTPLAVLAVLFVPLSYFLLWRTRFGLRLRSCGENPVAAESLGVNVYLHKYVALVVSGALAGMGGASLVLLPGGADYLENQTNGRGFIGLAAMIFGNWRRVGCSVARRCSATRTACSCPGEGRPCSRCATAWCSCWWFSRWCYSCGAAGQLRGWRWRGPVPFTTCTGPTTNCRGTSSRTRRTS